MHLSRLTKKSVYRPVIAVVLAVLLATLFFPGVAGGNGMVTTYPATDVGRSSATLNGQYSGEAIATAYFEYGLTTSYGETTTTTDLPGSGSFSAQINGLSPNTTYHFRAAVDVPDASIHYGSDRTFTTPASSPSSNTGTYSPPNVVTTGYSNITDSSVTVHGNLTKMGSGRYGHYNGEYISNYVLVYFKYGTEYNQTVYSSCEGCNVTSYQIMKEPGEFSFNIINLIPGTTYYFRAVAEGEGTAYGHVMTFETSLP